MKIPFFPLVLLFATVALLPAVTPESLEIKNTGDIVLLTDALGELRLRMGVSKISDDGAHAVVAPKQKVDPSEGSEVSGDLVYTLPDGTDLRLTENAVISPSKVVFKAAWPNSSEDKGYVAFYLKIPGDVADDLTITAGSKPVFVNFDKGSFFNKVQELVFRKTSTGEFLFSLSGEIPLRGGVRFDSDKHEQGITVDLHSNLGVTAALLFAEGTECEWTLSFKE
jgi:hypothetical protein